MQAKFHAAFRKLEAEREPLLAKRRALPLPPRLVRLLAAGRWRHPGEEALRRAIPWVTDPLVFLSDPEEMVQEAGGLGIRGGEAESVEFREYAGSRLGGDRPLPWVDVEKVVAVCCNARPGDDVMVALDYRTGLDAPRVIATDWTGDGEPGFRFGHRQVAATFDAFADRLGL